MKTSMPGADDPPEGLLDLGDFESDSHATEEPPLKPYAQP
jgi:hypothetical protein